jgi:hypothetical protein
VAPRKFFCAVLWIVASSLLTLKAASGPDDRTPDLNSLPDSDLKTVTVRFERSRCYGSCPAYTLTIHGDGRIEYVGAQHVKVTGTQEGRVEPGTVRALMSEFARAKFLSLPEEYSESKCGGCRRCTDMATAVTEIAVGSTSHRVSHYYGCACAPKALFELESAIDKAANSEQWTGDVSKQGPFGTTCFGP